MNALFYCDIEESDYNRALLNEIEHYAVEKSEQIYVINKPLVEEKYSYDYRDKVIVLLSPKHKIIFLDLLNNEEKFNEYYDDFIEDLGSISDKFQYREFIGRPKNWKDELTVKENKGRDFDLASTLNRNKIAVENKNLQRKSELLISLLVGSINDLSKIGVTEPNTILDKVKKKIILFDGEQTRFIYKDSPNQNTNIQGLSGTGKTELLLHKLKEIYTSTEDTKIFFTCHNKILASDIKHRVPEFFNFMKVEKQIEWEKRLWVVNAWGSENNKDSGVYSYICNFYNIRFHRFNRYQVDFDKACTKALEEIKQINKEEFEYAFDYILIDESQDFTDSFFELCKKVTSTKTYIAGDIFQNIFEDNVEKRIVDADFVLNRCYRTDPRTLMFAQALGMGLFEKPKLNWLTEKEWEGSGYIVIKDKDLVSLYRNPIRRFEDLETENISSVVLKKIDGSVVNNVINVLSMIIKSNPTVKPEDIAIILLDDQKYIYELANELEFEISSRFSWPINIGYESKEKVEGAIFISNRNNVKGLEFPFVICFTKNLVHDYKYRNTIYTMLTRSFIQSYLLLNECDTFKLLKYGLDVINNERCIRTTAPTKKENNEMKRTIIKIRESSNLSYKEFLTKIFDELRIKSKCRGKLERAIQEAITDKFNRDLTIEFIKINKKFYCK